MKSLGIVGKGFVGTAVFEGMQHAFSIFSYDKATGKTIQIGNKDTFRESSETKHDLEPYDWVLYHTDGPIFVCVPTPMTNTGACNTGVVEEVVKGLNTQTTKKGRVVVIKSTVVPGTTEKLDRECENLHVCFNPEFLTERNYIEDFKNQDRIILGGPREGTGVLKQMYETAYPNVPITKTSSTIAEMVKYTTNCFLATKVAFANDLKQICDKLEDVDYDKVIEYATKDKRLGMSHWSVPGPDGKAGFGGSCFPKDLNALIALANELEVPSKVMNSAWISNLHVRPEQDWKQLKGRAVDE